MGAALLEKEKNTKLKQESMLNIYIHIKQSQGNLLENTWERTKNRPHKIKGEKDTANLIGFNVKLVSFSEEH